MTTDSTVKRRVMTSARRAILACLLSYGPQRVNVLAKLMDRSGRRALTTSVRLMHQRGLLYVARWERGNARPNSPWVRVFAAGKGVDAPKPNPKNRRTGAKDKHLLEVRAMLRQHRRLTAPHCASLLGVPDDTVYRTVRRLRKAKEIYVCGWKNSFGTRGRMAAVFALGDKPDVPCPKHDRKATVRRHMDKVRQQRRSESVFLARQINPWANLLGAER